MQPTVRFLLLGLACVLTCQGAYAQLPGNWSKFADKPWWVVRQKDTAGKYDVVVQGYYTAADAATGAKEWNDKNSQPETYTYTKMENPNFRPEGKITPKRIEMPKVGRVDVGPLKLGDGAKKKADAPGKKAPSLAGKKFTGKIGENVVAFDFTGKDNTMGAVTIDGDLKGSGQWTMTESGDITIITQVAVFNGRFDGSKASGWRIFMDNSQPKTEWSFALDERRPQGAKAYRVEARRLNGFSGFGGLAGYKGPYTLDEARSILRQGAVLRDMLNDNGPYGRSNYRVQVRIVDGNGRVIEENEY